MNLKAAAADALAMTGLMAWEPEHRQRTMLMVQQFSEGRLDAAALRAAFGGGLAQEAGRDAPKGVAVIPLAGVLTSGTSLYTLLGIGTSLQAFGQRLRAAAGDSAIVGIVVLVDSPGGGVGLGPETAALMRAVRAVKPVTAVVTGLNASAAYWISSNAGTIEATPSASIGAIGVFTVRASLARQLEQQGVDVEVISAGKFKAEGLPVTAMTAAERTATQARVDESYGGFVSDVSAGRGVSESAVRNGFGEGRVVSAKQAKALGMIDRVALVEDSIGRALSSSGLRALASDGGMASITDSDADHLRRLRLLL